MSFARIFDILATQDDNVTAAIIAEALNSDQRIRQHMGIDPSHDVASLHRVARALAAHNPQIESEIKRAAPTIGTSNGDHQSGAAG